MALIPISLIIGQNTCLTAALVDSMSNPVPTSDPTKIEWTVDNSSIASITPGNKGTPSGQTVIVNALTLGITNITATYFNGLMTIQQVVQLTVNPNAVAAINITQGPVG